MEDTPLDIRSLLETPEGRDEIYRQVSRELWLLGDITHKLHVTQRKIHELIENGDPRQRQFFLLCSRRLGKSYYLVCRAFQQAIKKPGSRILYLAPWAKDATDIAGDLAVQILDDCPLEVKPEFKAQVREMHFPNGSIIRFKGVNGEHAQYLRGGAADLIILDECALMDDLKSVVQDVCLPMTATTKGKILFATTPPKSPSHESVKVFEGLAGKGAAAVFTIRDAPHIEHDEKVVLLEQAGEDPNRIPGILDGTLEAETTTALREFFCRFVTDASSAVLPEFDHTAEKEIVTRLERPQHFDAYVAMDPGMKDRTGLLFAYIDFLKGKLVIEDELLLHHAKTLQIAKDIKDKEHNLWGYQAPYMRVSDVDLRLIADLWSDHQLRFQKTRKDDLLAAINKVRNKIQTREIIIHPRCVNLIRQMHNAIWNKKATEFARPQDEYAIDGHYDLVAALVYLVRNLNMQRNPYPAGWFNRGAPGGPSINTWVSPRGAKKMSLGLFADTPFSRRLLAQKRR